MNRHMTRFCRDVNCYRLKVMIIILTKLLQTGKLATKPGSSEINVYSVVGTMAIILPVVALSILVFALEFMKGKRSPNRNPALKVMISQSHVSYISITCELRNFTIVKNFTKIARLSPGNKINQLEKIISFNTTSHQKVLEELIQRNEEEKPKNYSVSNRFVKVYSNTLMRNSFATIFSDNTLVSIRCLHNPEQSCS